MANRAFLDVARIRTHCDGAGEDLVVFGAPVIYQERAKHPDGDPILTIGGTWGRTTALTESADLDAPPDLSRRLYLRWSRWMTGDNGKSYASPDAPGMSGGSVWATNSSNTPWRASHLQLVGIEYAWVKSGAPDRYLKAYQMQLWLEMLTADLPELKVHIEPVVAAGRFAIMPRR